MNERRIKQHIVKQMLLRFLITISIGVALIVGGAFSLLLVNSYLPLDRFYILYRGIAWLSDRIESVAVFAIVVFPFLILIVQWRQLISYLSALAAKVETIELSSNEKITLPAILKDTEVHIDLMKSRLKEKELLAKQAEQRKNDLVVYLAHDLKTPISSIIGYLTLLRDEKQISQELHDRYVQVALNNAERLDDLINEFFEITRFNLAHVSLQYSTVPLNRMLEQMLFELHPLLADKQLSYRLELPDELELTCDVDKMQRVFDNLLRNAVYYSFEASEITITAEASDSTLKLHFQNSGFTIPPEKLERIFEQFYRLDSSRSTQYGGAGLGLAIAKQIVELHHGRITAVSSDNQIRFTIELPRLRKEKVAAQ